MGAAASEWGIHPKTLSTRLKARAIEPGEDGKLSTLQVCEAVYGDLEGERILKTREERIKLARENAADERKLLPVDTLLRVWSGVILEYRQRVLYSEIPQHVKEELLSALEESKLDEYFAAENKNSEDTAEDGPVAS